MCGSAIGIQPRPLQVSICRSKHMESQFHWLGIFMDRKYLKTHKGRRKTARVKKKMLVEFAWFETPDLAIRCRHVFVEA